MSITVPLEGFGGGGGASLNFDVKAYATESALLAATPKENTIGIITTTAINGWIFSAVEPTEPVEGMVWISVGTSSAVEFNALKKNAVQVYPLAAKQHVDSAWVNVTAKSYQDEEWIGWGTYLFSEGDQCSDITGGWVSPGTMGLGTDVTISDGGMSFGYASLICTNNLIKRGNNTMLYVEVDSVAVSTGSFECLLSTQKTGDITIILARWSTTDSGIKILDISNVTEDFYLHLYTYKNTTANVKNVWME